MVHSSNDIKLTALKTIKYISKTVEEVLDFDKVRLLLPEFTVLLRDRNTAVKATAELTLGFMLQLHKNDQLFDVSRFELSLMIKQIKVGLTRKNWIELSTELIFRCQ